MKVRIKKLPQARTGYQVQGSLANDVPAMGGADYNTYIGKPKLRASKYITAVPREEANLEAEGGETVYGDINGDGMPEHKTIKGPRHSSGGVPLNLPDDTFIYSDFRGMNIKEPEFLQMFGKGKSGKKSYTPAALAKQYDIEKYRKILQDPDSDHIDRKTAELMIKNYQNKLAALALVQEGKKGFPQGMPAVAQPMTTENQYTEETFVDPSIKQFASQIDGKLQQAEELQNTEEQDPDFAQQYAQAEEMNEGQPIAQPTAQYGMSMGGYDFPYGYEEEIPEAEYGMAMGANPRNYMGRDRSPMYARGGALRTYQGAEGASSTSPAGGAPANTPAKTADDNTLDVTGLDPEESNKRYYMWKDRHPDKEPKIMLNGKPAKYVPPAKKDAITVDDLKALHQSQYKFLETELKNPKSKVREDYLKEYKAALKDRKAYGNGKNADKRFEMYSKMDIPDDDAVNYLLSQKKRNDKIKETGVDMQLFTNEDAKLMTPEEMVSSGAVKGGIEEAKKLHKQYTDKQWTTKEKVASAAGITLPDPKTTILEQASTHSIARMQKNKKNGAYNNLDDDQTYAMHQFLGKDKSRETNTGAADETEMGKLYGSEYSTVSPIDGVPRNSTLAHGVDPAIDRGKFEAIPEEAKTAKEPCPECTRSDGSKFVPERLADGTCPSCEEKGVTPAQETEPEMWLQDRIKIAGAFGDLMGAKKYMPWAAKYDLRTPKPTFLDPTRELAANAEQANIQSQALAQFAGPQSLSARASGVMGAASKNAADVLAKYNNANVNIANQFESNIANIENQEQQLNTAAQQKLYDDTTKTNQADDNTRRALRNNLMNQTVSGITNMMKTDAMNQLYPQMKVDPSTGGKLYYDPSKARQVKPELAADDSYAAQHAECSKLYSDQTAIHNCVKEKQSRVTKSGGSGNSDADIAMSMYAQKGGFIYSDITYPFIF